MEKKKRGGKVGLVAAAGAVLLLAGGMGGGLGFGGGDALPAVSDQVIEQTEDAAVKEEETVASVTIEVKQDEYIVDGTPMKLGEIDSLIHQGDMYKASFVLVDNYASAKAWDDIMSLMVSHGISVVEQ